jgi:hypothetical protein
MSMDQLFHRIRDHDSTKGGKTMIHAHNIAFVCASAFVVIAGSSNAFDQGSKTSHEAAAPFRIAQAEQEKNQPLSGEVQERAVPGVGMPGVAVPSPVPSPPQPVAPTGSIKHFGIETPVAGGNTIGGIVELYLQGLVNVKLTSSNPAILKVPDTVIIMRGVSGQSFQGTTASVTAPTTVTVSAQLGGETKTVVVTVQPVKFSMFFCNPTSVPVGATTTCTAWLDAPAPVDTSVTMSWPEYGTQMAPYVKVLRGQRNGTRLVYGKNDGPQPRTITVNASYGGVTISRQLTMGPAYLKAVGMVNSYFLDSFTEGICYHVITVPWVPLCGPQSPYWFVAVTRVELHAPAPPGGLNFKMKPNPPSALVNGNDYFAYVFKIPGGESFKEFHLAATPVGVNTPVGIEVNTNFQGANDVKTGTFVVAPGPLFLMRLCIIGDKYCNKLLGQVGGDTTPLILGPH